ncbi:hypothetical protein BC830DRAFT_1097956 [Chytriomyces sp. MP71]|nr:hypothetical protein BC830DRAFT_1097956 [Chytriomyces sp. MP71]
MAHREEVNTMVLAETMSSNDSEKLAGSRGAYSPICACLDTNALSRIEAGFDFELEPPSSPSIASAPSERDMNSKSSFMSEVVKESTRPAQHPRIRTKTRFLVRNLKLLKLFATTAVCAFVSALSLACIVSNGASLAGGGSAGLLADDFWCWNLSSLYYGTFNASWMHTPLYRNISIREDTLVIKSVDLDKNRECPPTRPALIGILSSLDYDNTARRQYLRELYKKLNALQPPHKRIDIVFVLPRINSVERRYHLHLESKEHPNDIMLAHESAVPEDGLVLEWIRSARSLMYHELVVPGTAVPVLCRRYAYIGKGEDNAMVHLERLGNLIDGLRDTNVHHLQKTSGEAHYVGKVWGGSDPQNDLRHMSGMLSLLSADLVEYLYWSPAPHLLRRGVQDIQLARWIRSSGVHAEWIDVPHPRFWYNESDPTPDMDKGVALEKIIRGRGLTNDTVVVNNCWNNMHYFACLEGLFARAVL